MWLCIDQGGHSTRAAVLDEAGRILVDEKTPLETIVRDPHFVEHDPRELLESVAASVRSVALQLGRDCARVRAAGLATQRSTLVCAARHDGEALSPLISWQDRRGQDDLRRFESQADRIKTLTGLRLSPHYGVGKLRWCLQNLESVRRHLGEHDVIGAPLVSYLLHHIAADGGWRVDPVNASRTLLMDMRTASWSEELLALFELPAELLPAIQPCRSAFGTLELGGHAVPLTVATGDQAAAVYCAGEPAPGTAFVNIGTGAFIQAFTGETPLLDDGLLSSIVWQDAHTTRYVLEGTVNGAAAAVDTVSAEMGRRFDPAGSDLLGALEQISAAPLFLNGVSGLGSPDWVADFASRFTGPGDPAQRIAAVYESIVFLIARNLRRMRRQLQLGTLTVTGGVSRLDWLAQRLADVSGLPVVRPTESEATLLGLAYLVSEGRCRVTDDANRFEPAPSAAAQRRFADWTAAMDTEVGHRRSPGPT
jgi:glycerol kinase